MGSSCKCPQLRVASFQIKPLIEPTKQTMTVTANSGAFPNGRNMCFHSQLYVRSFYRAVSQLDISIKCRKTQFWVYSSRLDPCCTGNNLLSLNHNIFITVVCFNASRSCFFVGLFYGYPNMVCNLVDYFWGYKWSIFAAW